METRPHTELIQMGMGFVVSRIVFAAANLGLADRLTAGPKSAEDLAGPTGTNAAALYRLMRTLASLGVLAEQAEGRFVLTPLGEALKTGAPGAARATILSLAGVDQRPPGGRDLTRGLDPLTGTVFGMRRTFLEPYLDQRTTGQVVTIKGSRFYTVQDGVLYAGNPTRIKVDDVRDEDLPPELSDRLRTLFATFQQELAQIPLQELLDDKTREALRNLGYTR